MYTCVHNMYIHLHIIMNIRVTGSIFADHDCSTSELPCVRVCVCVRLRECVSLSVRACARVCERVPVCASECVRVSVYVTST